MQVLFKYFNSKRQTSALKSGFTLVEILVVCGIISILFSLGYANLRNYQRRQSVMAVGRQVEGDLRLAQEYAFQGKKPTGCSTVNGYIFQVNSSPVNTYDIIADCPVDVVVKNDVSFLGYTITPATLIIFKSLGEGTNLNQDAVIQITSAQDITVGITVTPAGIISISFI